MSRIQRMINPKGMNKKDQILLNIYTHLLEIENELEEKGIQNPIIDNAIHLIREEIIREIE